MASAVVNGFNHVFIGACNYSVNMGKQLYNSKCIQKTMMIYFSKKYQNCYKVDDVIKYMQKHHIITWEV